MFKASKFKLVIFCNGNQSQVGNHSSPHNDTPFIFYLFKIEQERSLKDIVVLYARSGFLFSQIQFHILVYEIATREGQKGFSPVKQKAGRYWLKGFYQWFPELRKKIAVNLSIAHVIGANLTQLSKFLTSMRNGLISGALNTAQTGSGTLTSVELVTSHKLQLWLV